MSLFAQHKEIPLWPEKTRGSNEIEEKETIIEGNLISNITKPTLTIVLPEKNVTTGSAVVICPGGGYVHESIYNEGIEVAKKFALYGITGIVLKYRLPNKHADIPLLDALRAIRVVRYRAKDWGIDPDSKLIAYYSNEMHVTTDTPPTFLIHSDDDNAVPPENSLIFYKALRKSNVSSEIHIYEKGGH